MFVWNPQKAYLIFQDKQISNLFGSMDTLEEC